MNLKWCLFRSEREQLVWIITWECIVLSSACGSVFWSLHMAKMAVNSVRMFLWVNWPLAVFCLCTSHTVTVTYKHTHTLQHKDTRDQWGRAHWLVWGGRGLERRGDQTPAMQGVKSMDFFFLSSIVCSWHQSKIKNTKIVGCGDTQLTVNNKILTV